MSEQSNDSRHICKCIYGEKCPASEPPTPTDTNTSFKEGLGELLIERCPELTDVQHIKLRDSIINLVDKEAKDCELPCTCKAQERGAYMHKLTCAENHNITVQNLRANVRTVKDCGRHERSRP